MNTHEIEIHDLDTAVNYLQNRLTLLSTTSILGGKLYSNTTQGLAATKEGEYFNVVSDNEEIFAELYKKENGLAVGQGKSYPSEKVVNKLKNNSITTVTSKEELLNLPPETIDRAALVKNQATGAMYFYDATKANENDGFYSLNGWILIGYHDKIVATLAGLKGNGTNEFTLLNRILDTCARKKVAFDLAGLTIHTSNLVASGNLKFVGSGEFRLFEGTKGTLLTTAYNLEIDGDITLNQNMDNNGGGTVGNETDCTIKHTGDVLILRDAKFLKASSMNVVTRAKKKIFCENINVQGGRVGLFAIPAPSAKVVISKSNFSGATHYDNIQILNGEDILIDGNTSSNSQRSGVVVSNTTSRARIVNNLCYGNKIDSYNQGGWGIVCSINTYDTLVSNNICFNNQRGGITIDVYPETGDLIDNRIVVSNNVINGLYNDTYSTTGISLNAAKYAVVSGNTIYKVGQGIHTERAHYACIIGNIFQDISAYFVQFYLTDDASFIGNKCIGSPVTGTACIRFIDANRFLCQSNTISNLTGATGIVFRVSGASADWIISDNLITRTVAGSGYLMNVYGSTVTGGTFTRNKIKATVNAAWQWLFVSDNNAQFSVLDNIYDATGIGYIYNGSNITAGDDTLNGSRNFHTAAPTAYKSRIGQIASIAGVLKCWNGTEWA